ncbi:MAG TPA: ABC transporter substrate-binding protein [Solirubrobacterales bacterium]|nr:ABC transporter substrate-binding protein [Solirubrobacterales bacterium]
MNKPNEVPGFPKRCLTPSLAFAVLFAILAAALLPVSGQAQDSGENDVLRIGWAQDPKNLNPFVGVNEEEFTIWAINWELLINWDPKDLSPAPGIAESWDVSEDGKTITFNLVKGATWSDGEPITSADVKFSLETLGEDSLLFTGYTSNVTKIKTPDDETVVLELRRPDARMIGGLFVYVLPEHIWGKVSPDDRTGAHQPEIPMVGSGPYIVTEFKRGRILRMEVNPEWRGDAPGFEELQFIRYGSQDAVERALSLGEIDFIPEVEPATFDRLGEQEGIETINSPTYAFTEMAFNLCSAEDCPDAVFNPAIQDVAIRQATAYAIDRERINTIATQDTAFVAHGLLPSFYKDFYEVPEQDYPYDPEMAEQVLEDAGWELNSDGIREKDGQVASFDLFARSESPYTTQMAKLISEQAAEVGIEYNVKIVSTDKLTELTIRKENGKPAPEFDSFIWGWGGDPYDPSYLLGLMTSDQIGSSSDAFYSNPEYDRLYEEQLTLVGNDQIEERREVIQEMIAILQEDLPYITLTYDPDLEAYNTEALGEVERVCPAETGTTWCQQVSAAPLVELEPGSGISAAGTTSGLPGGVAALGGLAIAIGAFLLGRARGRREIEPLELDA